MIIGNVIIQVKKECCCLTCVIIGLISHKLWSVNLHTSKICFKWFVKLFYLIDTDQSIANK